MPVLAIECEAALGIVPDSEERRRSIVDAEFAFMPRSAAPDAQAVM
jgi:hypothetical protein